MFKRINSIIIVSLLTILSLFTSCQPYKTAEIKMYADVDTIQVATNDNTILDCVVSVDFDNSGFADSASYLADKAEKMIIINEFVKGQINHFHYTELYDGYTLPELTTFIRDRLTKEYNIGNIKYLELQLIDK